jgi:hypothetical protein
VKISDLMLPVISAAMGVFGLFVDPARNRTQLRLMVAALLVVAAITLAVNYADANTEAHKDELKQKSDRDAQQQLVAQITDLKLIVLQSNGFKASEVAAASTEEVNRSVTASKAAVKAISESVGRGASDLKIQYFPHFTNDVNPSIVLARLRQLAASVSELKGNPSLTQLTTNCIWAGDQVSEQEVRSVAQVLTAAGVTVRDIRQLQVGSGEHSRLIEIGSSAKVAGWPALSADELQNRPIRARTDPKY